jgi:putative endonuclease
MGSTNQKQWTVYILRCAAQGLYVGMSANVAKRLAQHNAGAGEGARYTCYRRPVKVAWTLPAITDKELAARIEKRLKLWLREEKERLIAGDPHLQQRVGRWLSP